MKLLSMVFRTMGAIALAMTSLDFLDDQTLRLAVRSAFHGENVPVVDGLQ